MKKTNLTPEQVRQKVGTAAAEETRQLAPGQIRALVDPETLDDEARTVDVIFSTDNPVLMYGEFYEVLSHETGHVRTARLESGAPVLDNHKTYGSVRESVLGVVASAKIEDGKGRATLRFSKRDDVSPIWNDIKDGIIRNISVGYRVFKYEEIVRPQSVGGEETTTFRAIDWEPYEISIVPAGADHNAGIRSAGNDETLHNVIFIRNLQNNMKITKRFARDLGQSDNAGGGSATPTTTEGGTGSNSGTSEGGEPGEPGEPSERKVESERKRSIDIISAVNTAGLSMAFAERLISDNISVDKARELIIKEWGKAGANEGQRSQNPTIVTGGRDEFDRVRSGMTGALMLRAIPGAKLEGEQATTARAYASDSLVDFARSLVSRNGSVAGMSKSEIVGRALATTDFPLLIADVGNNVLRAAYATLPVTGKLLGRRVDASDFKTQRRSSMHGDTELKKVGESGEFKAGSLGEGQESYRLETYGRTIALTRQAIINDDLGAFTRLLTMFGRSAAELENKIIWDLIINNVKLSDGVDLFHATHKNLITGVLSEASLAAGRLKMRKQTDAAGQPINVLPKFLIVPAELELSAEKLLSSVLAASTSDVNVFANKLQIITEPRLTSAAQFYLAADPSSIDMIEYSYLSGQDGLFTESRNGFDVDGVETKVRLDFGAGIIDHRGLVKSSGV